MGKERQFPMILAIGQGKIPNHGIIFFKVLTVFVVQPSFFKNELISSESNRISLPAWYGLSGLMAQFGWAIEMVYLFLSGLKKTSLLSIFTFQK